MCDSPNWVVDVDDGSSDAGQGTCQGPSARRGTAVSRSGHQPSASGQASAREQRVEAGEQALGDAACSNHDGEKDLGVSDTSLCPEYPAGLPCKVSPSEGCRAKQQQRNLWPDTCTTLETDQTWWSMHAGDRLLNFTLFLLFRPAIQGSPAVDSRAAPALCVRRGGAGRSTEGDTQGMQG